MRKYLRNIARHNMDKEGITSYNKHGVDEKGKKVHSWFSKRWREYAVKK